MVMDALRSCGVTWARLQAGSDELTPIRWFWAAKTAQSLPFGHSFGHPAWRDGQTDDILGAGVLWAGSEWRSCKYPAPPGIEYHGLPAWYVSGIPALGPVAAQLCAGQLIASDGGLELGGYAPLADLSRVSQAAISGRPLTALSVQTVSLAPVCACGEPDTTIVATGLAVAAACGCGLAESYVVLPLVYAAACGCATVTTALSVAPVIQASACGCSSATTALTVEPRLTAAVCACGESDTTIVATGLAVAAACGCGLAESYVVLPLVYAAACGCATVTTALSVAPVIQASACGCGEAATGVAAVAVPCCPGALLPLQFLASVTNVSGCGCLAGVYTLKYIGDGEWQSATMLLCETADALWTLYCNASLGTWVLAVTCINNTFTAPASSTDCANLIFEFDGMLIDAPGELCGFCAGSINVVVNKEA